MAVEKKVKALTIEIEAIVKERGSNLMDLAGVGPVVVARVMTDVGDVARFADHNRFASWGGTAPLDVSCREQTRPRLPGREPLDQPGCCTSPRPRPRPRPHVSRSSPTSARTTMIYSIRVSIWT